MLMLFQFTRPICNNYAILQRTEPKLIIEAFEYKKYNSSRPGIVKIGAEVNHFEFMKHIFTFLSPFKSVTLLVRLVIGVTSLEKFSMNLLKYLTRLRTMTLKHISRLFQMNQQNTNITNMSKK